MGTCRLLDLLARDVGRMAADRSATQRRATNDQKSIESMHRAGRLPAITGETVNSTKKVRVRIVGDGTMRNTKIMDAETGEPFAHVQRYSVTHEAKKLAQAVIEIAKPSVDLECDAVISVADGDRADDAIEAEIQAKGLTAPRVTLADLDANIVHTEIVKHIAPSGQVLRWAVLTTRSGFAVTGKPSCAVSPANDDPVRGETTAVVNARDELWALMGYELKCRLHAARQPVPPVVLASTVDEVKETLNNTPEGYSARFVATQAGRFTDVSVPANWPDAKQEGGAA